MTGLKTLAVFSAVLAISACGKVDPPAQENAQYSPAVSAMSSKPNIVIFYVDDLGYGDLSSYGAVGVETPNVDALAAEGIRYTDAHSPASTCTPSRYSLLTGEYAFRNKAAILPGDAPLIINPDKFTIADMAKQAGYATAVVGKWHLGLGDGSVDWNQAVKPGPLELGFDYSFLLPATGDRVPTVYLENHHVVNLSEDDPIVISYKDETVSDRPLGTTNPELLRQAADKQHSGSIINGISRIGWMAGGKSAEWVDEEFPEVFTQKAIDWIAGNKEQPFLLFFPFHDIHVPRLPHPMFQGKSSMGPRGDAIVQMDWMTGQIVNALKEQGLYDNTLIIFSSDNGPVLDDGYADQSVELLGDHDPAGGWRGGKYSAFEAGTRVPMIVTYPNGMTQPGESDAMISHIDLFRSLASYLDVPLQPDQAPDSEDLSAALLDSNADGRAEMLEEAFTLVLRRGNWKYIAPPADMIIPAWLPGKKIEHGHKLVPQLYDLTADPGEQNNLAEAQPQRVAAMQARLDEIIAGQ